MQSLVLTLPAVAECAGYVSGASGIMQVFLGLPYVVRFINTFGMC